MDKIYCEDCQYFNSDPLFAQATADICGFTTKEVVDEESLVRRKERVKIKVTKCSSCRKNEDLCGQEAKWFIKKEKPILFS